MPIYEYACPKCGEFEITQRITENPLKKCPTCKSKVRKLISSTSFQLKGSGWYVTDYAKKGEGKDAGASKESTASKDASASKESGASAADGGSKSSSGESKTKDKPTKTKKEPAAKAA